jgi:hypothetical protein
MPTISVFEPALCELDSSPNGVHDEWVSYAARLEPDDVVEGHRSAAWRSTSYGLRDLGDGPPPPVRRPATIA